MTDKVPYHLEIVQPRVPLVRAGTMNVKVVVQRDKGFDAPLTILFPFNPPGVGATGSITIDGVSLTVNQLHPGGLQLSLIEYTLRHTTLGELSPGQMVTVETDMIGAQVQHMLIPFLAQRLGGAGRMGGCPQKFSLRP